MMVLPRRPVGILFFFERISEGDREIAFERHWPEANVASRQADTCNTRSIKLRLYPFENRLTSDELSVVSFALAPPATSIEIIKPQLMTAGSARVSCGKPQWLWQLLKAIPRSPPEQFVQKKKEYSHGRRGNTIMNEMN